MDERKYAGMTVNERLYAGGWIEEFETSVELKDVDKVILILKAVELEEESIPPILESLGLKSGGD